VDSAPESWRVAFDPRPALLHEALYIRDAANLPVGANSANPPPLRDEVPRFAKAFSSGWRESMGDRWIEWWEELVLYVAARQIASLTSDIRVKRGQLHLEPPQLIQPSYPDGERGQLSGETFNQILHLASHWSPSLRAELRETHGPSLVAFDHHRISSVARMTAARLRVSEGAMRAVVMTLSVTDKWATSPMAGVLLCSESVFEDEGRFTRLLSHTFESGLDA
jgi:hypothetical protein